MNSTHIHLLLNHFPVIGTLIGSLLLIWGIVSKQIAIKNAAGIILITMALLAIPVYLTGEPAEEAVENLPGVSESFLEMHEEAATFAIWLMGITGIAALIALFLQLKKSTATNGAFLLVFVFSCITFLAMARTGYYGGKIRHTEIRSAQDAAATSEKATEPKAAGEAKGDDDD